VNSILSEYYFTLGEVITLLILLGATGLAISWVVWRALRRRLETMEQALTDARTRYDREYFRALHDHLQSAIAHEIVKGLDYISTQSRASVEDLGPDDTGLRDKQHRIIAKAAEMTQRAKNVTRLFAPEPGQGPMELLNIRRLVESVLLELNCYAESRGVTLRHKLADTDPVTFHRNAALESFGIVIHNAIRYSHPGRVVKVTLFLNNPEEDSVTWLCVDVKDNGIGIPEEDQDKIFELRVRGDGLIEPGSGLGLYVAREAMRRHGGELILVRSSPSKGSTFRLVFPYSTIELEE
jgi:signal transduction histidine kinase